MLMQPTPWKDGPDSDYAETLECYTKAAQIHWYQGQSSEAQNLITPVFTGARSAMDRAPAYIIQSRILSREGKMTAAFGELKTSLVELGVVFKTPTSEACDHAFRALRQRLRYESEADLVEKPVNRDPTIGAMGSVFVEAISAAFWSDSLVRFPRRIWILRRLIVDLVLPNGHHGNGPISPR